MARRRRLVRPARIRRNVASDEWAYAFTNLPKYYKGKEIHYSVTEEAVNGYKPVSLTGGKTVPQQPNQWKPALTKTTPKPQRLIQIRQRTNQQD